MFVRSMLPLSSCAGVVAATLSVLGLSLGCAGDGHLEGEPDSIAEATEPDDLVYSDGTEAELGQVAQALACAAGGVVAGSIGTADDDTMTGGVGDDVLLGLGCHDTISGAAGNDDLLGGAGNDSINGGGGTDNLLGGPGSDDLDGSVGSDFLVGGPGADTLFGGGDASSDTLVAGCDGQADTLDGGPGSDLCIGEVNLDLFNNCETVVGCP